MTEKRFMLITVCDREISTEIFPKFDDARKEMKTQFMECFNITHFATMQDADKIDFDKDCYFDDDECNGWDETSAWYNEGPNHANYDWQIVEV